VAMWVHGYERYGREKALHLSGHDKFQEIKLSMGNQSDGEVAVITK